MSESVPRDGTKGGYMKKILRNNSIIITALCIMIAIVWYLNYADGDKSKMVTGDNFETVTDGTDYSENLLTENGLELSDLLQTETGEDATQNATTEDIYLDANLNDNDEYADISDEDMFFLEDESNTQDLVNVDETTTAEEAANVTDTMDGTMVADNGELVMENESNNNSTPGEAVLASTSISAGYFSSAKLTREQNRAREKESLLEMMESDTITDEVKQKAVDNYLSLTDIMEKENATELLLEAKGFDGAVVTIIDNCVDVVINAPTITEQQIAQIESIVERKTNVSADSIIISPVVVEE